MLSTQKSIGKGLQFDLKTKIIPSVGAKGGLSPKRKKPEIEEKNPSILTDPTSVTLMMSYLITNAGPAFDNFAK